METTFKHYQHSQKPFGVADQEANRITITLPLPSVYNHLNKIHDPSSSCLDHSHFSQIHLLGMGFEITWVVYEHK